MGPDDESNLVPSWDQINAKIARDRGRHEARFAEVAREIAHKTGGGRVRPFFLIADPVWNGDAGTFLMMQLGLSPYDDWNVLILPDDERVATAMHLPVHPNGNIPAFVQAAEDFMRQAQARLNAAHAEAGRSTHEFAAYGQTKNDIKAEVRGLAARFADKLREGWMQSR